MKPYLESTFALKLQQALAPCFHDQSDQTLAKSMAYSLLNGGKRIRPQLVYESASSLGLAKHLADPIAISIEMVHAFSLIHDDLPCMDDDDFRRGLPSNHRVFGEAVALLSGDALLNQAHQVLGGLIRHVQPDSFFRTQQFFCACIGTNGILAGQTTELALHAESTSLDQLLRVQHQKTTALFEAAILMPVLLSGAQAHTETFQEYQAFAKSFGFAFQAADDLSDWEQDQNQRCKSLLQFYRATDLRHLAHTQLSAHTLTKQFSTAVWLLNQLKD